MIWYGRSDRLTVALWVTAPGDTNPIDTISQRCGSC